MMNVKGVLLLEKEMTGKGTENQNESFAFAYVVYKINNYV